MKNCGHYIFLLLLFSVSSLRAQNPSLAQKRYEEATKVLQAGDREKAIPYFARVVEADSTHKNALYNLSILLLESGDPGKALKYADVLVRRYPELPKVFALRGKIRLAADDLTGAFADFTKQNEIGPAYEAYSGLGAIALQNRDYPGAESFFSKAIDLFPESASAHNDRAVARVQMDKELEAMADFRHASLLSPFEGYITQNFGLAYRKSGQFMVARNLLKESSDKEGTVITSLNLLGIIEVQSGGNLNDALTWFLKAIENEPDDLISLINTGAAYLMLNDIAKSKKFTDLALSIAPDMPEALFNRGVLYFLEENDSEACRCWEKASEKNSIRAKRFYMIYCNEN